MSPTQSGTYLGGGAAEKHRRSVREVVELTHKLNLARLREETWRRFAEQLDIGIENMALCPLCLQSLSQPNPSPATDGSQDRKPPGFSWPRNEWNTSSGSS
jgi:hypothetical protein